MPLAGESEGAEPSQFHSSLYRHQKQRYKKRAGGARSGLRVDVRIQTLGT